MNQRTLIASLLALLPSMTAACASSAPPGPGPAPAASSTGADSLDAFFRRVAALEVAPGFAVAVVQRGRPAFVRGYGWADVESRRAVEPGTPFYIASATKSFTALAAALLAHEGRLELDAPLSRAFPGLTLRPPLAADSITLRSLLTHTSGVDIPGMTYRTAYSGEHTPEVLMRLLSGAVPRPERGFAYTNVGYVVAGMAIERAAGASWKDVLDERVFTPLGMEHTTAYASEAARWERPLATPYQAGETGLRPASRTKTDATMHAAGGMITTAEDLARWLQVQLGSGSVDGRQLFPAAVIAETHRAQAAPGGTFYRFTRDGYGLGWYTGSYEGEPLLHHFGNYAGWRTHVSFMPRAGVGVAVLTNTDAPGGFVATDVMAAYAYDLLLGKPGLAAKYAPELDSLRARDRRAREGVRQDLARRRARTSRLSRPLSAYTGVYRSEVMGTMVVREKDGALEVRIGDVRAVAEPFTEPESVRVELIPGQGSSAVFHLGPDGRAVRVDAARERFDRVGDAPPG
jgi:CubicO group peptidase (beta-lactamase class C family)